MIWSKLLQKVRTYTLRAVTFNGILNYLTGTDFFFFFLPKLMV